MSAPPETERLVKMPEVIERLGVCRQTVNNWRELGVLVPVQLGTAVRWRESDINRIIAEGAPSRLKTS